MAIVLSPTSPIPVLTAVTITENAVAGAGLPATIAVNAPSGWSTVVSGLSDGSSDFAVRFVPQERGPHTVVSYDGPVLGVFTDQNGDPYDQFPAENAAIVGTIFYAVGG